MKVHVFPFAGAGILVDGNNQYLVKERKDGTYKEEKVSDVTIGTFYNHAVRGDKGYCFDVSSIEEACKKVDFEHSCVRLMLNLQILLEFDIDKKVLADSLRFNEKWLEMPGAYDRMVKTFAPVPKEDRAKWRIGSAKKCAKAKKAKLVLKFLETLE